MYYLLECYGPADQERQAIDSVPPGISWARGEPFSGTIATPLKVTLDGDGILVPMFNRGILLFSDELLKAVREAGVDNIDAYDVELIDPVAGKSYSDYKAINIIGLVAAADLSKSSYHAPSGTPLIDTDFDSLVIDDSRARGLLMFRLAESVNGIVIHESVRAQIERHKIPYIDFVKPSEWIG